MSMSTKRFIGSHSHIVCLSATALLALVCGLTSSLTSYVLLLAVLKVYAGLINGRPDAVGHSLVLLVVLSIFVSFGHAAPSLHALSTPAMSLVVLSIGSALTSVASMITIFVDARIRLRTPLAKLLFFPTAWASLWTAVSYISPIGRLVTWSPMRNLGPYTWTRQVFGPSGIDWIVAAWAVVGTQVIGNWIVGGGSEEHPQDEQLISHDLPEGVQERTRLTFTSGRKMTAFLAAGLVALTIPSLALHDLPLPAHSDTTTPFTVGCVLPPSDGEQLTFAQYLKETDTMRAKGANVVVWPEGAVRFNSPKERDDDIEKVRKIVANSERLLVGVSFEDFVPDETAHRAGIRRNGFLLVGREGIVLEYYKRMLVPFVESFSMTPSTGPPPMYTWDFSAPKGTKSPDWAPLPPYKRPIPITASICLDFSSPQSFAELPSRPALVLAPARTWHVGVGQTMWDQALARAEETGTTVLWCDGGEGGLSGVAGGGMREVVQVGQGSWMRTIGLGWPFDEGRTLYAALAGDFTVFAFWWALLGVSSVGYGGSYGSVIGVFGRLRAMIQNWRERRLLRAESGERAPLLIDD